MWLEAIMTEDDLTKIVAEFLPVKIFLDGEDTKAEKQRWLQLFPATNVALVADKGLRLKCRAELSWSFVGIEATAKIDELIVVIRPDVTQRSKGTFLDLSIQVEAVDFHILPDFVDEAILKAVNTALAAKNISWNTSETLTRTIGLGAEFEPIESLALEVQGGSQRIKDDALALVLSFRVGFLRND
jgi:hypothetical protein